MKIRGLLFGLTLAAVGLFFLPAGSAMATPVYTGDYVEMYLKQNTFPSDLSEQKIYLDADEARTITGHVGSQTGTPLVMFSSTTDILDAASGFSTIKATDGYINNLTITAPDYWFQDLIFSVNMSPNSADLTVIATDSLGETDSFAGWALGSGQNDILVLSLTGNLMESVTLNSRLGFTFGGIDQLKETQISGLTPVSAPVPEPATMLLLVSGLVGLAGLRKRFKK